MTEEQVGYWLLGLSQVTGSHDSDFISHGSLSPVTLFPTWQKLWKWVPPCSHLKTVGKSNGCVRARMPSRSVMSKSLRPDGLGQSWVSCIAGGSFTIWATGETHRECTTFFMGRSSHPGLGRGVKQQLSASPFPAYEGQLAALLDKEQLMCLTDGKYTILTLPPNLTNLTLLSILFPQRKDVIKHHLSFHRSFPLLSLSHIIFDTVSRNWNQLTKLTHLPSFLCSSVAKECAYNTGYLGSILGSGKSPGEGTGNPLQYPCLENPKDRGAGRYTLRGRKSRTRLSNRTTYYLPAISDHCKFWHWPECVFLIFANYYEALRQVMGS